MRAKVKDEYPLASVRAFGGLTFVRYEWRAVPDGHDEEAGRLEELGLLVLEKPAPEPEPEPNPKPKPAPRRRRKPAPRKKAVKDESS